jgi:hypothetical protein
VFNGASYYKSEYQVIGLGGDGPEMPRDPMPLNLVNKKVQYRYIQIKETFKCLVIGDWGVITDKLDIYYDIFPILAKVNDTIAAFVFLGDMAYDICDYNIVLGYEDSCDNYYVFLKAIEFLTSRIPFMPTLGNHEYGPKLVYSQIFSRMSFKVPGNLQAYSFEIGNIRFQTANFF